MRRDNRKLLKALRQLPHVTGLQVFYASTILGHVGLEASLEYVKGLKERMCPTLPFEAAEAIWHEELQGER